MSPRTEPAFLLGAGFSQPAGLPLSRDLTELMLDRARGSYAHALNYVVGQVIAHDARAGASPSLMPNVERVASAVKLLATRRELEIAPFISAWDSTVDALDAQPPKITHVTRNKVRRALGLDNSRPAGQPRLNEFLSALEDVLRQSSQPEPRRIFEGILNQMVRELSALLTLPADADLSYLGPFAQWLTAVEGPVTIATLNYDLVLEACLEPSPVTLSTGISDWGATGSLDFKSAKIELLKLHGSLSWQEKFVGNLNRAGLQDDGGPAESPLLVFGQREKLQPQGPFLQLLEKFRESISRTHDIVVIGYGFGDEHINFVLEQWVEGAPGRRLTIVDPGFDARREHWLSLRGRLLRAPNAGSIVRFLRVGAEAFLERLHADGLESVLSASPTELESLETFDHPYG